MPLRRLLHHLRNQDWVSVTLQFLIVAAGVFLGIQASNWNETRADASRARDYLSRIEEDIEADMAAMDRSVAYYEQTISYARKALDYTENGALAERSPWKTVLAFYQAGQFYPYVRSDATYKEMMSAGDLRLIHKKKLGAALGSYYANSAQSMLQLFNQLPKYRETIRGVTPSSIQEYIWKSCYLQRTVVDQKMIDCDAPITDEQALALLQEYLSDPQTIRQLRFWATQMSIQRTVALTERANAAELVALVAAERTQ